MNTIGICRETKNKWERRAPLVPADIRLARASGNPRVIVQPSARRVFGDLEYQRAGAAISGNLDACDVILGVKEIRPSAILPGKTYAFFSHITKGQSYNRDLLRRLIDTRSTLIDYERITDDDGRRLVYFGRHAGYAGMIDALWALGRRLDHESVRTPLHDVKLAHQYASLDEAMRHIRSVGDAIRHHGLPPGLRPIVFAIAGSGNVARGARAILDLLPTIHVDPDDLLTWAEERDERRDVVFITHLGKQHRYRRAGDQPFDERDFAREPSRYSSALAPLLPHITVLVNGIYWEPGFPRLVSNDDLADLWNAEAQPKLRVIGDITCDIGGSIEATVTPTTPDDPVYVYDVASSGSTRPGVEGDGPVILAVDNLPAELPLEASEFFSAGVMQFLPELLRCDWSAPFRELSIGSALRRGVVVHRGELTPDYAYLEPLLRTA